MVIGELRARLRRELRENPNEGDWIIRHVTAMSSGELIMHSKDELEPAAEAELWDIVRRRRGGEPLQYILGETEFMGLRFFLTPHTLIPRADTETLAATAIDYIGDGSADVLDIGTGSGCVGVSIGKHCKNARVTLLDFKDEILTAARKNAECAGVDARYVCRDIMSAEARDIAEDGFDAVVSNPPYIETDVIDTLDATVRDYEPRCALDGGADGLVFYRRIAALCRGGLLRTGGALFLEIGFDQGGRVPEILFAEGFSDIKVIKDLCGRDRVVAAYLKDAPRRVRAGGSPGKLY